MSGSKPAKSPLLGYRRWSKPNHMDVQLPAQLEVIPVKKQRRSFKPPALKEAVIAKAMLQTSNAQIARDLAIDPSTVKAILNASEIQAHVQEVRSAFVTDNKLWKAKKVICAKLDKGSESAATTILRGFNVLQARPEITVQNNYAASYMQIIQAERAEDVADKTLQNNEHL